MDIQVIYARPYEEVRSICHDIKKGDYESVKKLLDKYPVQLEKNTILIPIPGHKGSAILNATLCRHIVASAPEKHDYVILDCLHSDRHEPYYDLKKRGVDISRLPLNVTIKPTCVHVLRKLLADGYKPVLVDNVIDTGKTAGECLKAIHPASVLTIGDTGNWKTKTNNV